MPLARARRERGLGQHAIELGGEVGDQAAVGDDSLDRPVGMLRRHGDVLLVGGAGKLVLERKGRRGRHAIRGHGRQMQRHDAHARRRKHGFPALGRGPRGRHAAS